MLFLTLLLLANLAAATVTTNQTVLDSFVPLDPPKTVVDAAMMFELIQDSAKSALERYRVPGTLDLDRDALIEQAAHLDNPTFVSDLRLFDKFGTFKWIRLCIPEDYMDLISFDPATTNYAVDWYVVQEVETTPKTVQHFEDAVYIIYRMWSASVAAQMRENEGVKMLDFPPPGECSVTSLSRGTTRANSLPPTSTDTTNYSLPPTSTTRANGSLPPTSTSPPTSTGSLSPTTTPTTTTPSPTAEELAQLDATVAELQNTLDTLAAELPDNPELQDLVADVSASLDSVMARLNELRVAKRDVAKSAKLAKRNVAKIFHREIWNFGILENEKIAKRKVSDTRDLLSKRKTSDTRDLLSKRKISDTRNLLSRRDTASDLNSDVVTLVDQLKRIVEIIGPVENKSAELQANYDSLLATIAQLQSWLDELAKRGGETGTQSTGVVTEVSETATAVEPTTSAPESVSDDTDTGALTSVTETSVDLSSESLTTEAPDAETSAVSERSESQLFTETSVTETTEAPVSETSASASVVSVSGPASESSSGSEYVPVTSSVSGVLSKTASDFSKTAESSIVSHSETAPSSASSTSSATSHSPSTTITTTQTVSYCEYKACGKTTVTLTTVVPVTHTVTTCPTVIEGKTLTVVVPCVEETKVEGVTTLSETEYVSETEEYVSKTATVDHSEVTGSSSTSKTADKSSASSIKSEIKSDTSVIPQTSTPLPSSVINFDTQALSVSTLLTTETLVEDDTTTTITGTILITRTIDTSRPTANYTTFEPLSSVTQANEGSKVCVGFALGVVVFSLLLV